MVLKAVSSKITLCLNSLKATIHEEVKAVQDSIEEYVAFTDKKFASENDFVRYQLAGEMNDKGGCTRRKSR